MARDSQTARWERTNLLLTGVVVSVVLIGVLYWAQSVLMPLALAIFLTFLLSPVVTTLQRWHLGRVPAVVITTVLATALLGTVAWLLIRQLSGLMDELPSYSGIIKAKVEHVRSWLGASSWSRLESLGQDLNFNGSQPSQQSQPATEPSQQPPQQPIIVGQQSEPLWVRMLPWLFRPTLETLGQIGLMAVLLIFMLLKREDLRNRFIRLAGHGRMTLTTKAVDDASQRISRFLLMQAVVNSLYALVISAGLALIGVKYPFVWGFLAGAMRYIPYIGAPLAALFPITLSLVQFTGWWHAGLVVSLFTVVELITANVIEPHVYGHSIGVSEVALLTAAAFWGFLWGPVGLILSCPLTVCLVVLGKYVPNLEFLTVLLGDEPPLPEDVTFYQRLAAKDQDEAAQIVLTAAKAGSSEDVYDALLVPALTYANRDQQRDLLDEEDKKFILESMHEIMEDIVEKQEKEAEAAQAVEKKSAPQEETNGATVSKKVHILGVPARDEVDHLALEMLAHVLDPTKWELQIASAEELTAELVERIEENQPALICIASLPPGGLAHTRYLCKRLHGRFPHLHIVVGRWGAKAEDEGHLEPIRSAGAEHVETTLLGTRDHLNGWLPALLARERAGAPPRGMMIA